MRFFSRKRAPRPEGPEVRGEWTSGSEFDEAWKRRIARMASLITVPGVVADFGCGMMWLETMLSPRNSYLPIDFVRRDDRTLVLDLNTDTLEGIHADVAFLSGVMEYVKDLGGFARRLQDRGFRQIIASYCTLDDHPDMKLRQALNWRSHLSLDALTALFRDRYDLTTVDHVSGDTIMAFSRREP
jgi:hypothetical protein